MPKLADAVAFLDPMEAVYDLNEELLTRLNRLRYSLGYANLVGMIVATISGVLLAALVAVAVVMGGAGLDPAEVLIGVLVFGSSFLAWNFSRQELQFLQEFRIRAAAINRSLDWDPHPRTPEGEQPIDRLLKHVEAQDKRFAALHGKKPHRLKRSARVVGASGAIHDFDVYFAASPSIGDFKTESLTLAIRAKPRATVGEVRSMKESVEDVIKETGRVPMRAIILQTADGTFSEDVIQFAQQNPMRYLRHIGNREVEWKSPVELIGEDPSGAYNFGTVYFG